MTSWSITFLVRWTIKYLLGVLSIFKICILLLVRLHTSCQAKYVLTVKAPAHGQVPAHGQSTRSRSSAISMLVPLDEGTDTTVRAMLMRLACVALLH
jgi:hypothetical protein